jgi:hypothetical protein
MRYFDCDEILFSALKTYFTDLSLLNIDDDINRGDTIPKNGLKCDRSPRQAPQLLTYC